MKDKCYSEMVSTFKSERFAMFLGLARHYRRFICDFAGLALPLSELTKKDCAWNWGSLQEKAFVYLKVAL